MALTKAQRRAEWKKRTTETAEALRAADAKVTLKRRRTVPISATVLKPGETKSELVKQYEAAGGSKFLFKPTLTHREQNRINMLSRHPEQLSHREQTRIKMLAQHPERLTHREQTRLRMLSGVYKKEPVKEVPKVKVDDTTKPERPKNKVTVTYENINTLISTKIKRYVKPSVHEYYFAGVEYGRKHPEIARLAAAGIKVTPKLMDPGVKDPAKSARLVRAFSNGALTGIREEPLKTALFLALPGAFGAVMKGAKFVPVVGALVKSERIMKLAMRAVGLVYTHDIYTRVNGPVVTGYKDGKVLSETSKTLSDGSIETTQEIEQNPTTRKPTIEEKTQRLGGIFATELGPMAFGTIGIQKVSSVKMKKLNVKPLKIKPKIKTKIVKAGKVVKIKVQKTKAEIKKLVKSSRSKRITRLYTQIQAKHNQIALAKTPTEKAARIKDLKILEKRITAEVAKKNKRQSLRLKSLLKDERAEVSILSYRPKSEILDYTPRPQKQPKPKPKKKRKVAVAEKTKTTAQRKLETLLDYKTAKELGLIKKPKIKTKVKPKTKVKTVPITKPKTKTKTKTKTAVKTKTKTKTKTKVKTAVAVKPKVQTKVKPKTLVKTKTAVTVKPKVKTAVKTKVAIKKKVVPKIKPIPVIVPLKPKKAKVKKKKKKVKKVVKSQKVTNPVPSLKAFLE